MRKILAGAALFFSFHSSAQTLFTYGKDSVSVNEFLHAFQKNNNGNKTEKALQEYLDLYIASRLKIKEAETRGYDTLPQLLSDMASLRTQILPAYEKDEASLNKLADEAFNRSQKEIHLAHIFIGYTSHGIPDSAKAGQKAKEAYDELVKNVSFSDVAKKYSDDPSAKNNGGDLGYITVFSLPYELENLAYTTARGKISQLYQSKAGFHIFKNLGERKALGHMKAAQILIAFPPDASPAQKNAGKKLADSLYSRLLKGDDFGKLATSFSNDYISASANGVIPEFGVGQYDPAFENVAYSLKDGAFSKPFETAHGYHIVKRLSVAPVSTKKDAATIQSLKEKIETNDRLAITKEVLVQKVLKDAPFQKLPFQEAQLWAFTDSLFDSKKPGIPIQLNSATPLIKLGQQTLAVSDWIVYAQNFRYKQDGSGYKPYTQVWTEFINTRALDYYRNNLENFNADFRGQMKEFKDGNLFFEIMQRQIWGPAQTDTATLKAYYDQHKKNYVWTSSSADAVIFYAGDEKVTELLSGQLKKSTANWRELVNSMSDKVTADSGRFELNQIPNGSNTALRAGAITAPAVNKADNTTSLAYITRIYTTPDTRSFEEARGLVINDYQAELEKKWIADLKKKYPVTVNQNAWTTLLHTARK